MNLDVIVGVGGTVAALAVSQWPRIAPLLRFKPKPPSAVTTEVSYQQSLVALSVVRSRLLATGKDGVDEASQKAIETLTLALVQGSDR